jgi:prepilin-type N-terminal cleavage/methylation domain-containing protein
MIRKPPNGFTLVELIVVIALIGILLVFSLPRIRPPGDFKTGVGAAKDLVRMITLIKHRALQDNRDLLLHLDIDGSRVWLTDSEMDSAAVEKTRQNAIPLPDHLRIVEIQFAGPSRNIQTDSPDNRSNQTIRFSRSGYSDGVILHITDNGSPVSLKISPFLLEVETFPGHVPYDECS